jgi:hypothetical protein
MHQGAPIGHTHTSHYGDPHSEEGDCPVSTCGPFEQQRCDLSLVKHDTQVDLNPGGTRICYTQELPSAPCYVVSGHRVGAVYDKVLIPNPDYKEKGCTESVTKGAATSSSSKDPRSARNDGVH